MPQVVVFLLHGAAMAGGLGMACAGDIDCRQRIQNGVDRNLDRRCAGPDRALYSARVANLRRAILC